MRNQSLQGLGGVWSQEWNLKELTEEHHQLWILLFNGIQRRELYQVQTWLGLTDWELFHDSMGSGAWPFLVGGLICLLYCDNERDLDLLNSLSNASWASFLEGLNTKSIWKFEAITGLWCPWMFWAISAIHCWKQRVFSWPRGLDNLLKFQRAGDQPLQLLVVNEE